ncbi:MAG: hypothetical protein U9N30_06320, partial [Campylobacterota bacterium]|nr:hypothetical protein [Campylobacterota bacterium]
IDLYGAAGVSVEGRIPVYGWFDVASIDAAIHFRTPSPTFLSLYARGCCCSGCASHTFYLIGNSSDANSSSTASLDLVKEVYPMESTDVSWMPELKVNTTFRNDGETFEIGDANYTIQVNNAKIMLANGGSSGASLESTQLSATMKGYLPSTVLQPNTRYKFSATVKLVKNGTIKKTQEVEKVFTTTADTFIQWSKMMNKITPEKNAQNVMSETRVDLYYSALLKNLGGIHSAAARKYAINVYDVTKEEVTGSWENSMYTLNGKEAHKKTFIATKPLKVYHFCQNQQTGEIKETYRRSDGRYYNPFKGFSVDGEMPDPGSSGLVSSNSAQGASMQRAGISSQVFTGLNLGESEVVNEEFSYYTEDTYTIKVKNIELDRIDYLSSFTVASTNEGEQRVNLTTNLSNINPSITVKRNHAYRSGTSSQRSQLYVQYETKAQNNEYPVCFIDSPAGRYSSGGRTCDTCGDCSEALSARLQNLMQPSSKIDSIEIDPGITRDEYSSIVAIVNMEFESRTNPEQSFSTQYDLSMLYPNLQHNQFITQDLQGVEVLKSATIKYYVRSQNHTMEDVQPIATKTIMIIDEGLEDIEPIVDQGTVQVVTTSSGWDNATTATTATTTQHTAQGAPIW